MGLHLSQCGLGRGLPPQQVVPSCIQPFGHNRNGRKIGASAPPPFFWGGGSWVFIEHNVAWTEAHLHAKCHLDPSGRLATIDMGRKLWMGLGPLFGEGSWFPSNTKSPEPRPTFVPFGILIHPAIWPHQLWAENLGLYPFWEGELGAHLAQCVQGRGLPARQVAS